MGATAPRVLIAASGSGGHLYPAVFIADAIRREAPEAEIEFVGSGRPLEAKIVEGAGYKRHVIRTVGLKKKGPLGLIRYLCTLPFALLGLVKVFKESRPQLVVGVGGYVSVLPVVLAWALRIPSWIHEADREPGLANKFLSKFASKISLAFKDSGFPESSRLVFTGHPISEKLREIREDKRQVGKPQKLAILGGSQGARAVDLACLSIADLFAENGLEVWHQCRKENQEALKAKYQQLGVEARVVTYIDPVVDAYRWADLVISRAGAGSVMELGVINKPAIFVPYPNEAVNYQKRNAMELVDQGKALLVEEGEQFVEQLWSALEKLLIPEFYQEMKKQPAKQRNFDASDKIAAGCLDLIK